MPATQILHCISEGKELEIEATDGTCCIAEAKAVFAGYRDPGFKKKVCIAKPATRVEVDELRKNATFAQMFDSVGVPKEQLSLTEHQITRFCEKDRSWLRTDGYTTFFLLEEEGEFLVTCVDVGAFGRLVVYRGPFGYNDVWFGGYRHRLVLPQL